MLQTTVDLFKIWKMFPAFKSMCFVYINLYHVEIRFTHLYITRHYCMNVYMYLFLLSYESSKKQSMFVLQFVLQYESTGICN
jgi:hypothetical protein